MVDTVDALRNRLILSAQEVKQLTKWPDAMVEDYINILNTFIELANTVNVLVEGADLPAVRYTAINTSTSNEDRTIVCTDELTVSLHAPPIGVVGVPIRIKRVGSGDVTIETVDSTGYVLNINYQSIDIQWTGTEWISL